jgi:hypothetical protein
VVLTLRAPLVKFQSMTVPEMVEHPPAISDLPTWRKILIACALAFVVSIGFAAVNRELTIYGSAPDHSVPAQGKIYKIEVMHGYIRYVTLEEKESPLLGVAGSWAGAAFVAAFFLWITSPRKSARKSSRVQPFIGPPA